MLGIPPVNFGLIERKGVPTIPVFLVSVLLSVLFKGTVAVVPLFEAEFDPELMQEFTLLFS